MEGQKGSTGGLAKHFQWKSRLGFVIMDGRTYNYRMVAEGGTAMEVGIIGTGQVGEAVTAHLLGKTARNLYVYDPEGLLLRSDVVSCSTAAEVCDRCLQVVVALGSPADMTALYNGIVDFIHDGQVFIDFTETSPAMAHAVANGMRRRGARYLDCGLFGREGLKEPHLIFVGGSGETFGRVYPLLHCIAPDCRYVGPSGRGQAMRLLCRALAARISDVVEDAAALAGSFGVERELWLDALSAFPEIADPMAVFRGETPGFVRANLQSDLEVVNEMARRAGLGLRFQTPQQT